MKHVIAYFLVAIFSIFIGSQITEALLLLPYWKSLPMAEFYKYYSEFGPVIIKFYTYLTIAAVLIPISTTIYCFYNKLDAFKHSVLSTIFAALFIAMVYIYFNDANQQFFDATLNETQLRSALITWGYWHWLRVILEFLSLFFLILCLKGVHKEGY